MGTPHRSSFVVRSHPSDGVYKCFSVAPFPSPTPPKGGGGVADFPHPKRLTFGPGKPPPEVRCQKKRLT